MPQENKTKYELYVFCSKPLINSFVTKQKEIIRDGYIAVRDEEGEIKAQIPTKETVQRKEALHRQDSAQQDEEVLHENNEESAEDLSFFERRKKNKKNRLEKKLRKINGEENVFEAKRNDAPLTEKEIEINRQLENEEPVYIENNEEVYYNDLTKEEKEDFRLNDLLNKDDFYTPLKTLDYGNEKKTQNNQRSIGKIAILSVILVALVVGMVIAIYYFL